jgi:arginase family enzyme
MEERPALKLVQVGIRTANSHQRDQARRFGITMIEMKDWTYNKMPKLNGPIYLSLDLDVLDPGFAPGVSHHEPGGMSTRDVIQIIHGLPNSLVGADIVELNPTRDPSGITAMVAAKFYRELVGRMLKQG